MKRLLNTAKFHVICALGLFFHSAFAASGMKQDGATLHFTVDAGEVLTWTEAFPSDTTQVFKYGTGTLELNADNGSYKGPVDIMEGVVKILHRNALGRSTDASILADGAVSVSNGAQLATYCAKAASQTDKVLNRRLILAGSGPDGTGALRLGTTSGWHNQDSYLAYVVLADDALIVNTDNCRYGLKNADLQGHELTTTGENTSGSFMLNSTRFVSSGRLRHKKLQTTWQNKLEFAGGAEGRIIFDEGAILRPYSGTDTICPWTVEFTGDKQISVSVNGNWLNTFIGPVVIDSTVMITGGQIAFGGNVTGNGNLFAYGKLVDFKSPIVRTGGVTSVGYFEKSPPTPSVMKVGEGTIVTNKLDIGCSGGRIGGMIQTGGIVYNSASTDKQRSLGYGKNAYGYYGMFGGEMRFDSNWYIGASTGAVGMVEVAGGVMNIVGSPLRLGYGGWGEIYMRGGKIRFGGPVIGSNAGYGRGTVTITLAGEGAPEFDLHYGDMAKLTPAADDSAVSLNINAGKFSANSIIKNKGNRHKEGAKAYLNFNGGSWKSKYNSNAIFGTGDTALDRVTVFERGAGLNIVSTCIQEADTPILRPSGRGILSISLPEGMDCTDYAGPPEVVIAGGGGQGATAHAVFDAATRTVTGVEVTCPGWDYESAPQVKICSADRTVTNECVAVLTENDRMDGGLTVDGTHQLTLKAVNTYRGDTVLKGVSTLVIAAAGALPVESTVVFAGGTMNNNSGVPHKKYAVDCIEAMAKGGFYFHGNIDFSDGAEIEIRNADKFPRDAQKTLLVNFRGNVTGVPVIRGIDGARQKVQLVDKQLKISNRTGMVLTFR